MGASALVAAGALLAAAVAGRVGTRPPPPPPLPPKTNRSLGRRWHRPHPSIALAKGPFSIPGLLHGGKPLPLAGWVGNDYFASKKLTIESDAATGRPVCQSHTQCTTQTHTSPPLGTLLDC